DRPPRPGVLGPRRDLRHDGRRVRAVATDRPEGLRRPERRRGLRVGNGVSARGAPVPPARRPPSPPPDVDPGPRVPGGRLPDTGGPGGRRAIQRGRGADMKPVQRGEILDLATYERMRDDVRREVIAAKAARRVHVGAHVTLLFENHRTVWYQVQEMLRTERITDAPGVQHELETYNELLGGPGELGATLLIEIDDPAMRAVKLREWLALPRHVYARLEDGARVRATFDPRQLGEDRVSSVQYLKFAVAGRVPAAFGIDLPELGEETALTPEQRRALETDLA